MKRKICHRGNIENTTIVRHHGHIKQTQLQIRHHSHRTMLQIISEKHKISAPLFYPEKPAFSLPRSEAGIAPQMNLKYLA